MTGGVAGIGGRVVRIGLLRLTDAATVVVATEKRLFAARDLDVRLSIEPSWANVADKLSYRQLDAAVMPPPLALAISLGLRGTGTPLIVPISLSLNGNSITVSKSLAEALGPDAGLSPIELGIRLREHLASRASKLRFAVVHVFSTHNLLLRYWLAASGIDPDREVELSVVPPAQTAEALKTGQIDGFCAGAPWGEVAARADVGRTIVVSSAIWRNHPEKCLAISRRWAQSNPDAAAALLDALLQAARFCDRSDNADEIAEILSSERYLALAPAIIRQSLPVGENAAGALGHVDRSVFFAGAATFPWRSHAAWFLNQMARWNQLPTQIDRAAAIEIYSPDLYRAAAACAGLSAPVQDSKTEGAHALTWRAPGLPSDLDMGPDLFCDGKLFVD
jgi:NitT/TauT family transport system ATP-binding protein/nitrate/nitrite transport system substrate-binding protein